MSYNDHVLDGLAIMLHESGREAVEKNLVYRNDLPVKPFCEWKDLSEDAKEGRRLMAKYLLSRANDWNHAFNYLGYPGDI